MRISDWSSDVCSSDLFTLILLGLVFGYVGFGEVVFYLMTLQVFGTMRESVLAAVPLFLFMGYLLERAGLMDRLFGALRQLLGPVRGALYAATILVAKLGRASCRERVCQYD